MPLPFLIPIAMLLFTTGTAGVVAGVDGAGKISEAQDRQNRAQRRHTAAVDRFRGTRRRADRRVSQYGEHQLLVQRDTLGAFTTWLEDNEHKVRQLEGRSIDGVDVRVPSLPAMRAEVFEARNLLAGTLTAVATGIATRQVALLGVRMAATSGTGAAIAGLSGIAEASATLAWLGGGTLAAGGGGMALGATMLTGIAAAPALLLTGLALNAEGCKALTAAQQSEADVNVQIAKIERHEQLLHRIVRRIDEVEAVVTGLDQRALTSLAELQALDFDPEQHVQEFMRTALLMRALREVLNTAVVGSDGDVSTVSKTVITKHEPLSRSNVDLTTDRGGES